MPVIKKPKPVVDDFIQEAGETVKTEKRKSAKPSNRENGNPLNHNTVKTEYHDNGLTEKRKSVKKVKALKKNKKMTVYLNDELYLKWKGYELKQLQTGKKVSFQGVVEAYLKRLL